MTAVQILEPPRSRQWSRVGILLYLILFGWLLSRALITGTSQRMRELPFHALPLAGRDGMVLLADSGDPRGVQGIPVRSGAMRSLIPSVPTGGTVVEHWLTPSGGAILRTNEPAVAASGAEGAPPPWGWGVRRARLWSAGLDGSPARELLRELRMEAAVPSGDACFWLRPSDSARAGRAARSRRLMRTPLNGGRSREICAGLPAATRLEPLGGGVTWAVFQRGSFRMDRCVALPPHFEVEMLEDCAGRPDLLDGRLYWLHYAPKGPFSAEPARMELTSASLDGSDRKVIADLLQSPDWLPDGRLLGVHRGRLYCLLSRRSGRNKRSQPTLCEVSATQIRPIATLQGDAGPVWFDDRFLYYTRIERRENWLNWSKSGLILKTARVLYRIRLPD